MAPAATERAPVTTTAVHRKGTSTVKRDRVSCGVDLGSTNIKVVAVSSDGTVVARHRRPTPRPGSHPSINPEQLLRLVDDMLIEAAGDRWSIASVCTAGVGEDGVLTDGSERAIGEALAWFDPRRVEIFDQLPGAIRAAAAKDVTGVQLDPARAVVGWQWAATAQLATHSDRTTSWVALTDYPAVRWTGRAFMSDTLASRTAAWGPRTRTWLDQVVHATLGDTDLLGPVLHAGEIVGRLVSTRLADAGVLDPDTIVVAGGHDHAIGGSLVDRIRPGAVLDSMGTAEVVVRAADDLPAALTAADPALSVSAGLRGRDATMLAVAELARNLTWAGRSDDAVQHAMSRLLAGETGLPSSRAALLSLFVLGGQGGQPPAWTPEAAQASPTERAAAALVACAVNGWRIIDLLQAPADAPVFAAGGWTRSPGWMAIKDSFGTRRVEIVPEPELTGVSAALIAGDALGWNQDPSAAAGYTSPSRIG
jgi:sugar (pentulose or hexulose) kinase